MELLRASFLLTTKRVEGEEKKVRGKKKKKKKGNYGCALTIVTTCTVIQEETRGSGS